MMKTKFGLNLKKQILSCFFLMTFCLQRVHAEDVSTQEFQSWWYEFRTEALLPEDLKVMGDYFVSSDLIERCSKYWLVLNQGNIQQITHLGYQNFKQTVACNYFTWLVDDLHGYGKNLYDLNLNIQSLVPASLLEKKHAYFSREQSLHYNRTTALYYFYLLSNGAGPYLEKLEEPFFGNPPSIVLDGKSISQDVLNSLAEYLSIARSCDLGSVKRVLEVGAGSGRTAYCFLKLMPQVKYVIADIPPALYLSQTYLSEVFPDRKIFKFRPFQHFQEIESEFINADIIFMTPDQMLLLPEKSIDLFMAIDCLHEMKQEEVQLYFNEADRLASLFYFKCWKETVVPFDDIPYSIHSYPVSPSWRRVFEEGCFVPSTFFHSLYEMTPK